MGSTRSLGVRLRDLLAAGSLTLLAASSGCTYFTSFGAPGLKDVFPGIRERDRLHQEASIGSMTVVVRYGPGDEKFVPEALAEVSSILGFLARRVPSQPAGRVVLYLAPGTEDESIKPRGRGTFVGVLLTGGPGPLMALTDNRVNLCAVGTHELAHAFLSPWQLSDRWLDDGIPEYLARAYGESLGEDLYKLRLPMYPPLAELHRARLAPWGLKTTLRAAVADLTNPAYMEYLGEEDLRRYSAASELVRRWFAAAEARGIADPLRDLLQRVATKARRIGWPETEQLCLEQTGKTIAEIAKVPERDLQAARLAAWRDRAAPAAESRVSALRTLSLLGLPPDVSAADLLPALSWPISAPGNWRFTVLESAGMAIGASGDGDVALQALDLLHKEQGYLSLTSPQLWLAVYQRQPETALKGLSAMMAVSDDDVSLQTKEAANRELERLTGRSVSWKVEEPRPRRMAAAKEWMALVTAMPVKGLRASFPSVTQRSAL